MMYYFNENVDNGLKDYRLLKVRMIENNTGNTIPTTGIPSRNDTQSLYIFFMDLLK